MNGYVYVILNPELEHYKVGVSQDVSKRLAELQTGSSVALEVLMSIETSDPYSLEKELHARFAGKRLSGEWFKLTEQDLNVIAMYRHNPKYAPKPAELNAYRKPSHKPKRVRGNKPDWKAWNNE